MSDSIRTQIAPAIQAIRHLCAPRRKLSLRPVTPVLPDNVVRLHDGIFVPDVDLSEVIPFVGHTGAIPEYNETLEALVEWFAIQSRTPNEILAFIAGHSSNNESFVYYADYEGEHDYGAEAIVQIWMCEVGNGSIVTESEFEAFMEGFQANAHHYNWILPDLSTQGVQHV